MDVSMNSVDTSSRGMSVTSIDSRSRGPPSRGNPGADVNTSSSRTSASLNNFSIVHPDGSLRHVQASSLTAGQVLEAYPGHILALSSTRPLRLPEETVLLRWNTYYLHPNQGGRAITVDKQHERKSLRALHRQKALGAHYPQTLPVANAGAGPLCHPGQAFSPARAPLSGRSSLERPGDPVCAPSRRPNPILADLQRMEEMVTRRPREMPPSTGPDVPAWLRGSAFPRSASQPGRQPVMQFPTALGPVAPGLVATSPGTGLLQASHQVEPARPYHMNERWELGRGSSRVAHRDLQGMPEQPLHAPNVLIIDHSQPPVAPKLSHAGSLAQHLNHAAQPVSAPREQALPRVQEQSQFLDSGVRSWAIVGDTLAVDALSRPGHPYRRSEETGALHSREPWAPSLVIRKGRGGASQSQDLQRTYSNARKDATAYKSRLQREKALVGDHKRNPIPSRFYDCYATKKEDNVTWNSAAKPTSCIDFRHLDEQSMISTG